MDVATFQGESDHALDDKNRLIVPARFRENIGTKFYLTRGYGGSCIWVFTIEQWKSFVASLDNRPQLDDEAMLLKRWFTSTEVAPDTQGRFAIPQKLRQYAKIADGGRVVVVGTGVRIEIWAADEWDAYNDNLSLEMVSKAAKAVGI